MALVFPDISSIAMQVGPLAIRWYALAYLIGIIFTVYFLKKTTSFSSKTIDNLTLHSVFGIILGGRLGYIIFYNPAYYLNTPQEIFKIWHGGMSFHGALIGVVIALHLFCRTNNINILFLLDRITCAVPIGLFFGRVANFINGELYGRVTNVAWGVIFPMGGPFPRHPSQIYEALLEGLISGLILNYLFFYTDCKKTPGFIFSIGLMLYASFRIFIESMREPDAQIGLFLNGLTMGQFLSVIMLISGVLLIIKNYNLQRKSNI